MKKSKPNEENQQQEDDYADELYDPQTYYQTDQYKHLTSRRIQYYAAQVQNLKKGIPFNKLTIPEEFSHEYSPSSIISKSYDSFESAICASPRYEDTCPVSLTFCPNLTFQVSRCPYSLTQPLCFI